MMGRINGSAVALAIALLAPAALAPGEAQAQASAQDKAQANALFERGLAEYKAQRYREALPLFEASEAADPGVGTLLYLGECHRQLGHAASSWGAFKEAQVLARRLGDKREKVAADKAAEIEKKVSYLAVEVPEDRRVKGLEIKLDGRGFPQALWGTSVPVDPGPHRLELSAPDHESAGVDLTVAPDGARVVERVPALRPSGRPAQAAAQAPPPGAEAPAAGAPREGQGGDSTGKGQGPDASPGGRWRTAGYVAGGAGVVLGAAGAVVMLLARSDGASAGDKLDRGAYDDAHGRYTLGAVGLGLGAALAVTGAVLIITSPSSQPASARLSIEPRVGSTSGGVWLSAKF